MMTSIVFSERSRTPRNVYKLTLAGNEFSDYSENNHDGEKICGIKCRTSSNNMFSGFEFERIQIFKTRTCSKTNMLFSNLIEHEHVIFESDRTRILVVEHFSNSNRFEFRNHRIRTFGFGASLDLNKKIEGFFLGIP